jgi:hypothetical protein
MSAIACSQQLSRIRDGFALVSGIDAPAWYKFRRSRQFFQKGQLVFQHWQPNHKIRTPQTVTTTTGIASGVRFRRAALVVEHRYGSKW